jgi:hypothetical protein
MDTDVKMDSGKDKDMDSDMDMDTDIVMDNFTRTQYRKLKALKAFQLFMLISSH